MARTERKNGEISEQFEDVRNELRKLAGEIELKIHLAGMDARDAWNRLEPEIHERTEMAHDLRSRLCQLREEI